MNSITNWVIVILFNLITCFIARFGLVSNGRKKELIFFFGTLLYLATFVYGFFKLGFWGFVILIPVSYFLVQAIATFLAGQLYNKLRKQIFKKWAEGSNKNPGDAKEQWVGDQFKTEDEVFDEQMKKHFGKDVFDK